MSFIEFLVNLAAAIPILDKWATEFAKQWHQFKIEAADQKARSEQNTEDLQNEIGKNK